MTIKREFFDIDLEAALTKAEKAIGMNRSNFSYTVMKETFGKPSEKPKIGIIIEFSEENKKEVKSQPEELPLSPTDPVQKAIYVLEGIFKRMGHEVAIRSTEKSGQLILTVDLVEKKLDLNRGESREFRGAVQYLINRVFSSGSENDLRLIVDIGGTLEERSMQLTELADEISEKVKTSANR